MKALSPIVSVVILVVISISIASITATWMYELVTTTTNETAINSQQQVICRSAGLDFDSDYGYYGVSYNFSAYNATTNESDWIRAKVVNTGTVDLYGFTFEVTIINDSTDQIEHYSPTAATEKSSSDPLRASQSAIITADISDDFNASTVTLVEVKVLNKMCPEVAPSIEI